MPDTPTDEQKIAFVAKIKERLKLPASASTADVLSAVEGIRTRAASLSLSQTARAAASLTSDEEELFAAIYGDAPPQPSALTADEAALYASVYTQTVGKR